MNIKKVLIIILLALAVSSISYGNNILNKICLAIKSEIDEDELRKLEKEHKGKKINGEGYFDRFRLNLWGQRIVYVKMLPNLETPIFVISIRDEKNIEALKKLNKGDKVGFSGQLHRIKKDETIILGGETKVYPKK